MWGSEDNLKEPTPHGPQGWDSGRCSGLLRVLGLHLESSCWPSTLARSTHETGRKWMKAMAASKDSVWRSGNGFWEHFYSSLNGTFYPIIITIPYTHKQGSWSNEGTSRVREDCWAELAFLGYQSPEWDVTVPRGGIQHELQGIPEKQHWGWWSGVHWLESSFEMNSYGGWGKWRSRPWQRDTEICRSS